MAVYVDAPKYQFGRMTMCHMVADSRDELLAMADRIGVQRKWLQKAGTPTEHFDVCKSKRALAVAAGAKEVGRDEFVAVIRLKRSESAVRGLEGAKRREGMELDPSSDSVGAAPTKGPR